MFLVLFKFARCSDLFSIFIVGETVYICHIDNKRQVRSSHLYSLHVATLFCPRQPSALFFNIIIL